MSSSHSYRPGQTKRMALAVQAITALLAGPANADNPAEALEMPTVVVIGTTPLPGLGTSIKDVPTNVQSFSARDMSGHLNLAEFMEHGAGSVSLNSGQGNPFQPDINFRGFAASPLIGTPQGVSVFQDGVRINEPFGDVVNWDFIPQSAISSLQLIPGSNPLFGLNTLGGALAVYTKSGSQYPGAAIETSAGSFGRKTLEVEYGGKNDEFDYFFTANHLEDDGWADHNASRINQFFGKLGWQDETTDLDLSFTGADNRLEGTQTIPVSFLDNFRQAYTFPDRNINQLGFVTLKGSRFFGDKVLLGGNIYYRKYRNENVSSNVNDNYDGVIDTIAATNDRSVIDQDSYGGGIQLTLLGGLAGIEQRLVIGASGDFGKAAFRQDSQDAQFSQSRNTAGLSNFVPQTDAGTENRNYGIFVADTLMLSRRWTLTLSGRYNEAKVGIEDRSGTAPQLNGDHRFSRFNPALGINFNPSPQLTGYASYNEGMRAPTAVELTCADPNAPCKLPNNFIADPALKKVVSKTLEAGARGKWNDSSGWSAALYRTELNDDIQFVSSSGASANSGYFQNVGRTQREGVELSANTRHGALGITARYSYVNATFQSPFSENSPANPSADGQGAIAVNPGNRIPGIPRHTFKLRADYDVSAQFSVGADALCSSSVFARGDENNANQQVPGYSVVNLDGRYRLNRGLQIFARLNNLFDKRYSNFGVLGQNFFTGPRHSFGPSVGIAAELEQFRAIGAPRGAWIGLRYEML